MESYEAATKTFVARASEISGQEVYMKEIYGAGGQVFFRLFLETEENNFFDAIGNAAGSELFRAFGQMWAEQNIRNAINAEQRRIFAPVRQAKTQLVLQEENLTIAMGRLPTQKLVEEARPAHTARYTRQLTGVWKQANLFKTLIISVTESGRVYGTVVYSDGNKEAWNGSLVADRSDVSILWSNGERDRIVTSNSSELNLVAQNGKTRRFSRANSSYGDLVNQVARTRRNNQLNISIY